MVLVLLIESCVAPSNDCRSVIDSASFTSLQVTLNVLKQTKNKTKSYSYDRKFCSSYRGIFADVKHKFVSETEIDEV